MITLSCDPEPIPTKLKIVKVLPECAWKDIDGNQLYHVVYLEPNSNIYLVSLKEGYHVGDTVIYGYYNVY